MTVPMTQDLLDRLDKRVRSEEARRKEGRLSRARIVREILEAALYVDVRKMPI